VWWLAQQAPATIREVWTSSYNIKLERELWLTVLEYQAAAGVSIPATAAHDYRNVIDIINLDSINRRELVTRHDVKARIEEFNALAGHECIHLGMTSADVVDNVAQIKMRDSVRRLHQLNPARFEPAMRTLDRWPLRGIKGAVGTMQDQVDLLGGERAAFELDRYVADRFQFDRILSNTGQVYPRSLDLDLCSSLASCVFDVSHPLQAVLAGYLTMVANYAGETWNEGDVSTSVTRRVALPGLVFTVGALAAANT